MKILYDHQTFSLQDYGGISRLYTELLKQGGDGDVTTELSLLFSNNAYLKELHQIKYSTFFPKSKWKYKVPAIYNLNKIYTKYHLAKGNFDVFHPTYYDPYFLKNLKGKPFVVTVLDMIHEKLAHRYADFSLDKIVSGKKLVLQEASKIIAISESTKRDIVEVFGTDPDRIEVIYLGSSFAPNSAQTFTRIVEDDYILFIGNRASYKNFNFFVEAVTPLLRQHATLKIVCGGGGAFTNQEQEFLNQLGIATRVIQVPIKSDDTLINLYTNATCFVFPSLYEGFGIPVLEAFSCGCPSAISNSSSLPEVGGDAVFYFDAEDAQSMLQAVTTLVENDDERKTMIAKGYEILASFSWEKTREETHNLYRTLI